MGRRTVSEADALSYRGRSGPELMAAVDRSAIHANAFILCRQHGMQKIARTWGSRLVLACGCRRPNESYSVAHLKSAPTKPAVVED